MPIDAALMPLTDHTLPLFLLAAFTHPDRGVRDRLVGKLDDAVEQGEPLHREAELRSFLMEQPGTPREPFFLDAPALEIAVWVLQIAFSRRTPRFNRRWVHLVSTEVDTEDCGLVVNHQLKANYFEKRPFRRTPHSSLVARLVAGSVVTRLNQLRYRGGPVRATCRIDNGFAVRIRGDLPCPHALLLEAVSTIGQRRLPALGLKVVQEDTDGVTVRTINPEAMLLFSACLARGDTMVLRDCSRRSSGQVIVFLRDFEEDVAELPVVVSNKGAEDWLCGVPAPQLDLDEDDLVAISRWAYPDESWLSESLTRRLI